MRVYKIELEQFDRDGQLYMDDTLVVAGRTGQHAIAKAIAKAKDRNIYLKTRPIEVKSVERIAVDVL